jgi:sigma-E factor negative regulatory protein RseC
MLEQAAVVLHGDGPRAWVAAGASSACARCASGRGCGAAALSRLFARRPRELEVRDPIGVHAGERVVIGVDEDALLAAAVALYLPPLLGLLTGALVGSAVTTGTDAGPLVGGALGLAAGLWTGRRQRGRRVDAVILRRAGAMPEDGGAQAAV